MEVLLADVYGFCFGVRRAIELAEAAQHEGRAVHTLGPLVHNSQETARLDAVGIHPAERLEEVTGDTVVIRAHGANPETLDELKSRALNTVDATCPFVAKSQRIARQFAEKGLTLVVVGHPGHPEVQGILGYFSGPSHFITEPHEVDDLPAGITPGVIAQTTVNERTFREVVERIKARYPDSVVENTVCLATRDRQESARALAAQVEALYVIGGRHSSNTNRLMEICRQSCPKTFLIETAGEIDPADLQGIRRVGVTAGASTPDWLIKQVVERLQAL
jgi:4-hydroxy-3-methylbut-2-enyl diphosphate reductase